MRLTENISTQFNETRLSIVGPQFFSYLEAIVGEVESLGICAQSIDERGTQSFYMKAIFRSSLLRKLMGFVVRNRHAIIRQEVANFRSTHVIFISPESINVKLIESLKDTGIKVILYMWDSFDNKPAAKSCLNSSVL